MLRVYLIIYMLFNAGVILAVSYLVITVENYICYVIIVYHCFCMSLEVTK